MSDQVTAGARAERPLLADVLDPDELAREIAAEGVVRRTHPTLPLSIYSYSRTCQYEQYWTPVTTATRGLVVDDATGRVAAWCLPKFFNHGQHGKFDYAPPLPDEPFEVYDKVDGSLGIVFHHDGAWRAASKGSFISEQAAWAQRYLDAADTSMLDPSVTYLAEILYPENRIVVNYGDRRDMVLLAAFRADGSELPLAEAAPAWKGVGTVVRTYDWTDTFGVLAAMAEADRHLDGGTATGTDAEGWVIRFASGVRTKTKLTRYVSLHHRLTGITPKHIWRALAVQQYPEATDVQLAQAIGVQPNEVAGMRRIPGGPMAPLLEDVPDEYDAWVRGVCDGLNVRAAELAARIDDAHRALAHLAGDRGAYARAAKDQDGFVRAGMFLLLDGRTTAMHVWRAVKPEAGEAFRKDDEDYADDQPAAAAAAVPSGQPTAVAAAVPSGLPAAVAAAVPSGLPAAVAAAVPSGQPTAVAAPVPSGQPAAVAAPVPTGSGKAGLAAASGAPNPTGSAKADLPTASAAPAVPTGPGAQPGKPVVHLMRGLPASGKSTRARELMAAAGGRMRRVSLDDLRRMLDDNDGSKHLGRGHEETVLAVQDQVVLAAVGSGFDIVVDNTHLVSRIPKRLKQLLGGRAEFRVHDLTDVDVEECVRRDKLRPNPVGEEHIRAMALRLASTKSSGWKLSEAELNEVVPVKTYVADPALPAAVLCDIDGTLADNKGRAPYDWNRVEEDGLIVATADALVAFAARGDRIVLMSGRGEDVRAGTERWLTAHGVAYDELWMRAAGDTRPDDIVKSELFDAHVRHRFAVRVVLDDRSRVVALWRRMGLACWQVDYGDF